MSLHVRVPSAATAARLGEPQQVHGLFLPVSLVWLPCRVVVKLVPSSFGVIYSFLTVREFKSDFLELLRRRFGES